LTVKARLYGVAGIPEYWVFDIEGRTLIVHRQPGESGYGQVQTLNDSDDAVLLSQPESPTNVSLLMPPLPEY
jgi:Uma2 family endonuclease